MHLLTQLPSRLTTLELPTAMQQQATPQLPAPTSGFGFNGLGWKSLRPLQGDWQE